jgi:hypothetical protein
VQASFGSIILQQLDSFDSFEMVEVAMGWLFDRRTRSPMSNGISFVFVNCFALAEYST